MTHPTWLAVRQSGMCWNDPPTSRFGRYLDARAEDDRGDELRLLGLPVDLRSDQTHQDVRALAVTDQHHAAPVIVAGEIAVPRVEDVAVRRFKVGSAPLAAQPRDRHLPVHRRVQAAARPESRELHQRGVLLLGTDRHVAVRRRLARDRRVDVEAVHRSVGVARVRAVSDAAVRRDHRRGERLRAYVRAPGQAQPVGGIRVVDALRRRRIGERR